MLHLTPESNPSTHPAVLVLANIIMLPNAGGTVPVSWLLLAISCR